MSRSSLGIVVLCAAVEAAEQALRGAQSSYAEDQNLYQRAVRAALEGLTEADSALRVRVSALTVTLGKGLCADVRVNHVCAELTYYLAWTSLHNGVLR